MKHAILSTLTLLSLLIPTYLPASDWQRIVREKGPSVGRVQIKRGETVLSSGSCFIVDREGTVISNAHVITPLLRTRDGYIVLSFPQGPEPAKEYRAELRDYDEVLDVAILTSDVRVNNPCELAKGGLPSLMSEVLVMGYPLGMSFKATPGFVQAIQDMQGTGNMIDLSASVDPGNSGGPVFNKEGRVIGIVTAKIFGANFNLAIPSDNAIQFLAFEGKAAPVNIISEPAGAHLFVNRVYKGTLPIEVPLYNREYEFVIELDGYSRLREIMTISDENRILTFSLKEEGTSRLPIRITTDPEGAEVFINNVLIGVSPVSHDAEAGSKLRIRVARKGYRDEYQEHILSEEADLTITMRRAGLFSR